MDAVNTIAVNTFPKRFITFSLSLFLSMNANQRGFSYSLSLTFDYSTGFSEEQGNVLPHPGQDKKKQDQGTVPWPYFSPSV